LDAQSQANYFQTMSANYGTS